MLSGVWPAALDSAVGVRGRCAVSTCEAGGGAPAVSAAAAGAPGAAAAESPWPGGGEWEARLDVACRRRRELLAGGVGSSVRPGPGTSACRMSGGSELSVPGLRRGRGRRTAFCRRAASGTGRTGNGRRPRSQGRGSPPRHSRTPDRFCTTQRPVTVVRR